MNTEVLIQISQKTYLKAPNIYRSVEAIKVLVVEMVFANNLGHLFFIKYLPASAVRHPTNDMPKMDECNKTEAISKGQTYVK